MDDEEALLYGDGAGEDTGGSAQNNEQLGGKIEEIQHGNDPDVSRDAENPEGAEAIGDDQDGGDEDDDSDDDGLQVIIDKDKIEEAKTTIQNIGITKTARQLPSEKKGKFNVEDFDKAGTIDGQPAQEIDLEAIDDKPWKKPGADITDYFNYGFTEETWGAYCGRQKRMRLNESGAGLPNNPGSLPAPREYSGRSHNGGSIPTLGQGIKRLGTSSERDHHSLSSKYENKSTTSSGIAVLTADKRQYSKKIFENMDFSLPPPGVPPPPIAGMDPSVPPPNFSGPPPGPDDHDFDPTGEDQYDYGYEPTQESQWVAPPSTYLGGGSNPDAPPGDAAYEDRRDPWQRNGRRSSRDYSPGRDRIKREPRESRERRRSRSRSRDRYRERDRRERSDRGSDRDRGRRDRDRDRDKDRGDTDRDRDRDKDRGEDRDRDRDRGEDRDRDRDKDRGEDSRDRDRDKDRGDRDRKRDRSRSPRRDSKSPSSSDRHKHKKSKRDKRERSENKDRDNIKKEVKDEPEEYIERDSI